jgi:hypothetical protein
MGPTVSLEKESAFPVPNSHPDAILVLFLLLREVGLVGVASPLERFAITDCFMIDD